MPITARSPLRRTTLAPAAAALLGPLAVMPAAAANCAWNTGAGNWNALADWLACATGNGNPAQTPGSLDTASIGAAGVVTSDSGQSVRNLNNVDRIDIDAFGLNPGGRRHRRRRIEWVAWPGRSGIDHGVHPGCGRRVSAQRAALSVPG